MLYHPSNTVESIKDYTPAHSSLSRMGGKCDCLKQGSTASRPSELLALHGFGGYDIGHLKHCMRKINDKNSVQFGLEVFAE
ncbi:hypothetical protein RRG08_056327 [Elysia crispata]|uniref:Uncharacterized protein n=1 Tax=Elysia crispata TaxID=231223 RepID=A0AAE0YR40_9GAST|nr:hypothetical protein RRG08_056327 [Elysia crispata]